MELAPQFSLRCLWRVSPDPGRSLFRVHVDADLAAGGDGEGSLHSFEAFGDFLELPESLEVFLDRFPARSGRARDGIRRGDDEGFR